MFCKKKNVLLFTYFIINMIKSKLRSSFIDENFES